MVSRSVGVMDFLESKSSVRAKFYIYIEMFDSYLGSIDRVEIVRYIVRGP